jgi:uncharacterized cysteine cluster protein YcgN (CxxCxxCC family)
MKRMHKEQPGETTCQAFWQTKSLQEMTREEWESLCDGCGRCCLRKLENKKTGKIYYTTVSCYLLDTRRCRCVSYADRTRLVEDCTELTPAKIKRVRWLPETCAYRLLAQNKALCWWHPLVSGDPASVHAAGISVKDRVISEEYVHPEDLEYYIVEGWWER